MPFFNNTRDTRCPGPITGNPNQGLNDKVCILTNRVFDSGLNQVPVQDILVTLTNFTPANPTYPLTFVSCNSTGADLTITNLTVDRFEDRPNFARVTATVVVPISVNYVDNNGVEGTAEGTYTVPLDVIMSVPQPSIVPFEITAYGIVVCHSGPISNTGVLTLSGCITIILRVIAETQLLVPTYGYCTVPDAIPFTVDDACQGTTGLPLFPTCS